MAALWLFLAEGFALVRQILLTALPTFESHSYQLDGVCKVLDKIDLVAVTPTGSGKTGYLFLTLIVMKSIAVNPSLCPGVTFPKNPAIVVVYPTNSTEQQMEENMAKLGISALMINSDTVAAARILGRDLWEQARETVSMLILGPEQLISKGFPSCRISCTTIPSQIPHVGCLPEVPTELYTPAPKEKKAPSDIPQSQKLTKPMKEVGTARLETFRLEIWFEASDRAMSLTPLAEFLPDIIIKSILDNFARFKTVADVSGVVTNIVGMATQHERLYRVHVELKSTFTEMKKAKAAATKLAKA
ncbi:hypothetical protein B0H17DRAFT_1201990 [Mycena rosella]|uniref:DEAD/DEAH-box helicase domain-containing protein n=1 Tax=Mycena rosella TaxID=1033263 RepID=A0AAD7DF75_MYCRO|nr:hypothetical protein B0H17DRAFT_1201990 [Mycena rosella]